MPAIGFPQHKPTVLSELPIEQLNKLAVAISKHAMTAQLEILSAESAEELAIAISKESAMVLAMFPKAAEEVRREISSALAGDSRSAARVRGTLRGLFSGRIS